MGHYEKHHWVSQISGLGNPRRDHAGGAYNAFIPDPLVGRTFTLEGDVAADVTEAELAIARLNSRAAALSDTETLARLLLRAESVASSHIEGLRVSPRRLLRAAADQTESGYTSDDTALEVLANVDAMTYAMTTANGPITPRLDSRSSPSPRLRSRGLPSTRDSFVRFRTGSAVALTIRCRQTSSRRLLIELRNYSTISVRFAMGICCPPSRRRQSRTPNSRPSIPSWMEMVARVVLSSTWYSVVAVLPLG